MWQLVGLYSKQVYKESKNKSDLVKWYEKTYRVDSAEGKATKTTYNVPETMRFSYKNRHRSRIQKELDLLDEGKYEEYRRIKNIGNQQNNDLSDYEKYHTDSEPVIKRRQYVQKLYDLGLSVDEISSETGIRYTTITRDLVALGVFSEASGQKWSPADDAYLINNKKQMTIKKIASYLQRTPRAVSTRWTYLQNKKGIKKE